MWPAEDTRISSNGGSVSAYTAVAMAPGSKCMILASRCASTSSGVSYSNA